MWRILFKHKKDFAEWKKFFGRKISFWLLGIFVFGYLIFSSSISYTIGNTFFGKVPTLYNVNLANFFFKHAAYPVFGTSVPYVHHQLSRTYFIKGNLEKAIEEAKKELEIYPENTNTYYILGLTLGYMDRTHEAIDAFSKYIETYPESWAGRNDKAWLQFRIGDIDGAIETIEPVAKNFTLTPWVQNTYCVLLINKKRFNEAKKTCALAKNAIDKMTEKDWGHAYPGNDPRIYGTGLSAMKKSIGDNLKLLESR